MTDTNQKLREALPPLHTGCLPTLNQDPYPALGDWWVQLWDGSGDDAKVIVRVYGNSPEKAKQRAEAMCQALALPTADHIPDSEEMVADHLPNAGKMTNGLTQAETDASASVYGLTAAPVGERDLPQLPDPTYIYHDAEQGEDDLFEFSESGAVDEGCPKCKRLYTADQMRAYARAALSAGDAVDAQRYRWLAPSESDVNTSRSTEHMEAIITAWSALLDLCGSCKGEIDAAIDAAMRKGQL